MNSCECDTTDFPYTDMLSEKGPYAFSYTAAIVNSVAFAVHCPG